jgi:prepilin-type N-terminal cleavage/methylation domain-containing protein
MVKKLSKHIQNQDGFTLVEVMIALTLFALFISAFLMSQGANITMSAQMAEDIMMHNLAERTINEVLINPPVFTNATDKEIETKDFTEESLAKYKYTIEYKKLEIPDLNQLMGKQDNEDDTSYDTTNRNQGAAIQKMVFEKLKKNIEQIIWQVKVTITNKQNNYTYQLTSWITNPKARIDTNFGF